MFVEYVGLWSKYRIHCQIWNISRLSLFQIKDLIFDYMLPNSPLSIFLRTFFILVLYSILVLFLSVEMAALGKECGVVN